MCNGRSGGAEPRRQRLFWVWANKSSAERQSFQQNKSRSMRGIKSIIQVEMWREGHDMWHGGVARGGSFLIDENCPGRKRRSSSFTLQTHPRCYSETWEYDVILKSEMKKKWKQQQWWWGGELHLGTKLYRVGKYEAAYTVKSISECWGSLKLLREKIFPL